MFSKTENEQKEPSEIVFRARNKPLSLYYYRLIDVCD